MKHLHASYTYPEDGATPFSYFDQVIDKQPKEADGWDIHSAWFSMNMRQKWWWSLAVVRGNSLICFLPVERPVACCFISEV